MRSKAHIKSHPLHPILVAFPIAFFIGALLFDVLFLILGKETFWLTGNYSAIMPYGTYTAETVSNSYYTSVCPVTGLNLSVANDTITGVDLGDSAA